MLAAKNLVVRAGAIAILDDCSLGVRPGELLGVIGPNGAGKSTLAAALAGLRTLSSGAVWLDDRNLTALSPRERAQRIAYLPQFGEVNWPISVERLVELGRLPHLQLRASMNAADRTAVERALELTDLLALRTRIVSTLSGGERARALLARALATQSSYLVADEPAAHLDPHYQHTLFECLRSAAQSGTGVLVVLHDLSVALQFCTRLILMHRGKIAADGPPNEVVDAASTREAFGLRPLRVQVDGGESAVLWSR